jgi:sulfonate transport system ATP-binding protein
MASRSAGGLTLPRRSGRDRSRSAPGNLADGASVVSISDLSRSFAGRVVLDGLDLEITRGEFVALIGRSGSGKSTLLRGLAGLDPGLEGDMEVRGTVSMAFQGARLLPWKRVLDNVRLGLRRPDPNAVAREALAEVGLQDHHDAWPMTLSGGEAQRVSLARALVREPDLMLLDEPFGALDALTRISMHRLVMGLWERHRPAVLLVTHDVDEALALADRVLVLGNGRITHQAPISLERPREREHPDLISLRNRLLAELGVDTKGTTHED